MSSLMLNTNSHYISIQKAKKYLFTLQNLYLRILPWISGYLYRNLVSLKIMLNKCPLKFHNFAALIISTQCWVKKDERDEVNLLGSSNAPFNRGLQKM